MPRQPDSGSTNTKIFRAYGWWCELWLNAPRCLINIIIMFYKFFLLNISGPHMNQIICFFIFHNNTLAWYLHCSDYAHIRTSTITVLPPDSFYFYRKWQSGAPPPPHQGVTFIPTVTFTAHTGIVFIYLGAVCPKNWKYFFSKIVLGSLNVGWIWQFGLACTAVILAQYSSAQ